MKFCLVARKCVESYFLSILRTVFSSALELHILNHLDFVVDYSNTRRNCFVAGAYKMLTPRSGFLISWNHKSLPLQPTISDTFFLKFTFD